MEDHYWFSFKDENSTPILFYNSETGQFRWASHLKNVKCAKANLDEIPLKVEGCNCGEFQFDSRTRNFESETDSINDQSSKLLQDAATNTENISLDVEQHDSILDRKSTAERKNVSVEEVEVLRHKNDVNNGEFRCASSPSGYPFDDDPKDEDDNEYGQTNKESIVDNLFAMELSSVLSYEDLQQNKNHIKDACGSNTTESYDNDNEDTETFKDIQEPDPPMMEIKPEPKSEIPIDYQYNSDSDFSLVDLLPKRKKRMFSCLSCKRSFKTVVSLQQHEVVHHSGEGITKPPRLHACTICGKRFVEANCLKKHIRTHTGEKPYECPYCGKAFAQSQNLNKHKYIHTDKRPHECKECGKMFRQHSHLSRHKLIHTGEKPYQCAQCMKRYRTRSHLVRHMKTAKHEGLIDHSKKTATVI